MKRMWFFGTYLWTARALTSWLILFSVVSVLFSPGKVFAEPEYTKGPLTQADVARWKNYSRTSFADKNYIMYKTVFDGFVDIVFSKYKDKDPIIAFEYVLSGTPDRDTVPWLNSKDITSLAGLAKEEEDKNGSGNGREMAKAVSAVIVEMRKIEVAQNTKNLTETQRNEIIQNATNEYNAVAQSETERLKAAAGKCSFFPTANFGACINDGIVWLIQNFLLQLGAFLVWIFANMMNYAIQIGILNFKNFAPDSLYTTWMVIRQIVSLFIVFAGLWLGFMYIINKGKDFEKFIPAIIIFGLFVNFSYPLVRTVIDVSNIVSLNIYASTVGGQALSPTSKETAGATIMNKIGLQGLVLSATKDVNTSESKMGKLTSMSSIPGALMAVAFVFYAAYIFFVITFLIVTRTAVLVFIIVASPLLFVDTFIPKLGEYAKKMRGIFWEMLFVGPVFTIMLALTLKFLDAFSSVPKLGTGTTGDSTIIEFFNIFMMLAMLHIMFKVTKATSGTIGQAVTNFGSSIPGLALGAGLGGAAMLGRRTLGSAALYAQKKGSENNGWLAKDSAPSRMAFNALGSLASATYDGRNSSAIKWGASKIGMGGMGTGGKMGFDAERKNNQKNYLMRKDFAKNADREAYNALGEDDFEGRKAYIAKLSTSPSSIKTKLQDDFNRKRIESYNAIPEDDIAGRRNFIAKLDSSEGTIKAKLQEEFNRKALAEFKAFEDASTIRGKEQRENFEKKYSHEDDKKIHERTKEFDEKLTKEKEDKKEVLDVQKKTASGIEELNKRLGGGNVMTQGSQEAQISRARALNSVKSVGEGSDLIAAVKLRTAAEEAELTRGYSSQQGSVIYTEEKVKKPSDYGPGQTPFDTSKINLSGFTYDTASVAPKLTLETPAQANARIGQTTIPVISSTQKESNDKGSADHKVESLADAL